jgi:hypothetical protein
MPSYEIILKYNYNEFSIVWDKCKKLVYRNSRAYMDKQQKPIKLRLGIKFTIFKPKPLDEGSMDMSFLNDDEDIDNDIYKIESAKHKYIKDYKMAYKYSYNIHKDLNVSTKKISVYTSDTMKEIILSLENELIEQIAAAIEAAKGSGWTVFRYNKMYSILHTINTPRAGSYIKTPENMTIQNVD